MSFCFDVLLCFTRCYKGSCFSKQRDDDKELRKNFGFFRSGLDIFVLDKIFPTAVSLVKLGMEDNSVLLQCLIVYQIV